VTASATSGGAPYGEGQVASGDVQIRFACTDGGSGVAPSSADLPVQTVSAEGETALVPNPGACADNAGNVTRSWFGPVRIQRPRAPVAVPQPPGVAAGGPSAAATRALLARQSAAGATTLRRLGLRRLLSRGYRRSFTADQPGTVTEEVLAPAPRRARGRAAQARVVVARGRTRFTAPGTKPVVVRPLRAARRALRGKRSAKLVVRTTFAPATRGAKPIVVSRPITVRR
jgi:hypothetical protein